MIQVKKRSDRVSASTNGSDHIKVVIRVRPILNDTTTTSLIDIDLNDPYSRNVILKPNENTPQAMKYREPLRFKFNKCFFSSSSQMEIFQNVGLEMIDHSINGFNSCILAYGQTGSGKTHTMMGSKEQPGLIPLICEELFNKLNVPNNTTTKFKIKCSFFEIYQEQVMDLLNNKSKNLKIRENLEKQSIIENLSEFQVSSLDDVLKLLKIGNNNRTTASTHLNKQSSRSHSILTLNIVQEIYNDTDNSITKLNSNLKLVDLAGSEKSSASDGLDKIRQQEGNKINKSLTTLGRILTILSEKKSKSALGVVVPYRESILTRLLKENIGGNSKTTMVGCISPIDFDESLSTLRFATITSKIENSVKINKESKFEINEMIKRYEDEKLELLNHIESLKVNNDTDVDFKKLENMINWQNDYIDSISFSNSIKLKNFENDLELAHLKNEKLLKLALNSNNCNIPNDSKFKELEIKTIGKINSLIKNVENLNVLDNVYELDDILNSDLVMKYHIDLDLD
ncbi:hypothetical protein CANARDRAFT_205730 [[Candida] arabinofermentans NRRL YB-2248]|uniref:Kinesin motor domain-containing protein n=1 Tax=[Candida] arabinofermentans NRRL YB-2248 TaxID=983967 RepID=A0A1E4T5R9_9ASCO|nr:hypothetical protein CANARDRAFT_205730 [[Candida] arabinofermentans NRRL YB-2248]